MRFQIKHIKIHDFRAIDNLETDLWNRTIVSGPNESSKSTLVSAITYCLFGKSIDNDTTWGIVPNGRFGEVSPTIVLDCTIDERPARIERVYKAKKSRQGDFLEYATIVSVNGLELSQTEYRKWLAENLCDEQILRIFTNPRCFCEFPPAANKELTWAAQRRLLMSLIGGQQTDVEIVASTNRWMDLSDGVERHGGANVYLQYLKKQYTALEKQLLDF